MTARKALSGGQREAGRLLGQRAMSSKAKSNGALGLDDILSGVDMRVRKTAVKGLTRNGEPVYVFHRPISAARMIEMQEAAAESNKAEKAGDNPRHVERMVELLADVLCDESGELLGSAEQLKQAPADVLVMIMGAVTRPVKVGDEGNSPSAADSDSHTV